jgi:hypothetical protein
MERIEALKLLQKQVSENALVWYLSAHGGAAKSTGFVQRP